MATGLTEGTIHVPQSLMDKLDSDLDDKVQDSAKKGGLAIIVGNSEGNHVPGVDEDVEVMCKAFSEQDFTVWDMMDVSRYHIAGAILAVAKYKQFPSTYDRFVFYYCGRGGIRDNHPYIYTAPCDKDDNTLSIEEGIVTPLYNLEGLEPRFVFDCCLRKDLERVPSNEDRDPWDNMGESMTDACSKLDSRVSCSVSNSSSGRADRNKGGAVTQFFSKHLKKLWSSRKQLSRSFKEHVTHHFKPKLDSGKWVVHGHDEVDHPSSEDKEQNQPPHLGKMLSIIEKDGEFKMSCSI